MKTLLHVCCAPCANQCIDSLREQGHDLTAFWYNPNIHPYTEYRARRDTVREYCRMVNLPLLGQYCSEYCTSIRQIPSLPRITMWLE